MTSSNSSGSLVLNLILLLALALGAAFLLRTGGSLSTTVDLLEGQTLSVFCEGDKIQTSSRREGAKVLCRGEQEDPSRSDEDGATDGVLKLKSQKIAYIRCKTQIAVETISDKEVNLLCKKEDKLSPSPSPGPTSAPVPSPAPSGGVLFGPFHLPDSMYGKSVYTGAFRAGKSVPELKSALDTARANKFRVVVSFCCKGNYQAADRAFSVERYKQHVDSFKDLDLASYYSDGTLVGVVMFDEPQDPSNWGGKPVPLANIDAAAKHVKSIWPAIAVGTWAPPGFLKGYSWEALDFAGTNYTPRKGDYASWYSQVVLDAKSLSIGVIPSIGVSQSNPSANDVLTWGKHFLSDPYVCGMTLWRWGTFQSFNFETWASSPDVASSLSQLATTAKNHPASSCQK